MTLNTSIQIACCLNAKFSACLVSTKTKEITSQLLRLEMRIVQEVGVAKRVSGKHAIIADCESHAGRLANKLAHLDRNLIGSTFPDLDLHIDGLDQARHQNEHIAPSGRWKLTAAYCRRWKRTAH